MRKLLLLLLPLFGFMNSSAQTPKTVSIIGDSYSTFQGHVFPADNAIWYFSPAKTANTDVVSVEQTWWSRLTSMDEYELCVNNSFSGSTICNTGYNGEDCRLKSFIGRMNNIGDPDIILVFGGTNDSWANVPLGDYQYKDWSSNDLYCFRAGMSYMLSQLQKLYAQAEIYFVLNSELKPEVDESVFTICSHYDVPCIELVDVEKMSGHPSIKGMEQIHQQIADFLKK